jgi:two-component system, LytTR family, sensor kinase
MPIYNIMYFLTLALSITQLCCGSFSAPLADPAGDELYCEGSFNGLQIPPMILVTFIENAFKFGISNQETSVITIRVKANDSTINFYCRNKVVTPATLGDSTSTGLANTRHRLVLYMDNYQLRSGLADSNYIVSLQIRNK